MKKWGEQPAWLHLGGAFGVLGILWLISVVSGGIDTGDGGWSIDLGNVGEWVGGLATAGAVWFAYQQLRHDRLAWEAERAANEDRRRSEEEKEFDRLRLEAEKVEFAVRAISRPTTDDVKCRVNVANRSDHVVRITNASVDLNVDGVAIATPVPISERTLHPGRVDSDRQIVLHYPALPTDLTKAILRTVLTFEMADREWIAIDDMVYPLGHASPNIPIENHDQ